MKCCLCSEEIPTEKNGWSQGNNAEPLVENGRCCNFCNDTKVIPARLMKLGYSFQNAENIGKLIREELK